MPLCWWCCHECEPGPVLHMPIEFKNDVWKTKGQFCSWECMKAFNVHSGSSTSHRVSDLITLYRKRVYGKIESIKTAPSRFCLKAFGGTIDITEFRSPNVQLWISLPNEVHIIDIVKKKVISDDELVLKRDKPLRRDVNSIKNLLGVNQVKK